MRFLDPRKLSICLHCAYDLSGSADAKRCPECGAAIEPFDLLRPRRLMLLAALAIIPGALACLALALLPQSVHGFAKPGPSFANRKWGLAIMATLTAGPVFLALAHCFIITIVFARLQMPPALRGMKSSSLWRRLKREDRLPRRHELAFLIPCIAAILMAGTVDSFAIGLWFRIALGIPAAASTP